MKVVFPARAVHRLTGLALLLPLALWIGTGLLFHAKPGWDEAYEPISAPPPGPLPWERVVFSPAAVKARGLLGPGPVALGVHPSGLIAYFGVQNGRATAVDGTSGEPIPPASEDVARAFALGSISASRHPAAYGALVSSAPATHASALTRAEDPAFLFLTSRGKRVVVDRITGEVTQAGDLNERIDLLYRIHYLQWTPWKPVNAALVLTASIAVLLLAASGLRLAVAPPSRDPSRGSTSAS